MINYTIIFFFTFLSLSACIPAGVFVSDKGEVGASWGGYSASAGLGGLLGGNGGAKGGLHAEAGTPQGHFAAAGLGGSVGEGGTKGVVYTSAPSLMAGSAAASSNAIETHSKPSGTLYDDIFNIPQSVLRSVNELLNNKRGNGKVTNVSSADAANKDAVAGSPPNGVNGNTLYNDIFNIPQSVLSAVTRLLNRSKLA